MAKGRCGGECEGELGLRDCLYVGEHRAAGDYSAEHRGPYREDIGTGRRRDEDEGFVGARGE